MAKSGLSVTEVVAAGVPAIVVMGASYLLGYFAIIGLHYFTFLDFQDFINSATAFLPGIAVFYAFTVPAMLFSKHKEGERALEQYRPSEEAERANKPRPRDATDLLFDNEKNEWKDEAIFYLKLATLAAFVAFFGVLVALLFRVEVPLYLVWPAAVVFIGTAQLLLAYFDGRYDYGISASVVMGVSLSLVVFCLGVTASRIDLSSGMQCRTSMQDGRSLEAATLRRAGEHLLILEAHSRDWMLVRSDLVERFWRSSVETRGEAATSN